jgi:hypothetical protein
VLGPAVELTDTYSLRTRQLQTNTPQAPLLPERPPQVDEETVNGVQHPSNPCPNRASEAALEVAEGRSPIPECSDQHSIGVLDDAHDLSVPLVLDNEDLSTRVPADLAEDELHAPSSRASTRSGPSSTRGPSSPQFLTAAVDDDYLSQAADFHCFQNWVASFETRSTGQRGSLFSWGSTKDASQATVELRAANPLRKGSLVYAQRYNIDKEWLDSMGIYPFAHYYHALPFYTHSLFPTVSAKRT